MRATGSLLLIGLMSCRSAREPAENVRVASLERGAHEADDDQDTSTGCPPALAAARKGGGTPNKYVVPSAEQLTSIREVVERLLREGAPARANARESAAAAGFEIVEVPEVPGAVVLRETANHGGGAYLLRLGSPSRLLVQAPHTFYDAGTFPLACELFQRTGARALFVNTVHRYRGAPPDAKGEHPADVAHAEGSVFQASTIAFTKAVPTPSVVQLHGFGAGEGRGRVVLSAGERRPADPLVARAQTALTRVLGEGILRFPEDTSELGATTNVQGAVVREAGGRFLHVEMADAVRRSLLQDASLRTRVLGVLGDAVTKD
jgi:hypothetical protein